MASLHTRRAFVSALAIAARGAEPGEAESRAERSTVAPSEMRRFRDSATEFELTRLTDPQKAAAILAAPPLKTVSSRNNFLIYCSDRSGSMQAWRMDLKSGESRLWTNARALDPRSISLLRDERSLICIDDNQVVLLNPKPKVIYTAEQGWTFSPGFSISDDGVWATVVEQKSGRFRLRVLSIARGTASTIFEAPHAVRYVRFRPNRQTLVYNHGGLLTTVNPDGRASKQLNLPPGVAGEPLWSADGLALHYLLNVDRERGKSVQIREYLPDSAEDRLIGATTQFVSFARNGDSSVFAGVSGSKGAPYILLYVRSARRELTLAEHRSSSAENTVVTFSSNSQRLFYGSDREGKPAIYAMGLDRFVEKTETGAIGRPASASMC
ncbi:MAG: hypothetical protein H7Y20_07320 [Bryobacteraceae bacterium]|nr:hypothetical protein [Bryobacteraceae bacterium]